MNVSVSDEKVPLPSQILFCNSKLYILSLLDLFLHVGERGMTGHFTATPQELVIRCFLEETRAQLERREKWSGP